MMKKIVLILLFAGLLFTEVYLCSAFLPMSWQTRIQRILPKTHDYSLITHPNIEGEVDQTLRRYPALRLTFYAILVVLLALNTWLLRVVWRSLRHASRKGLFVPAHNS